MQILVFLSVGDSAAQLSRAERLRFRKGVVMSSEMKAINRLGAGGLISSGVLFMARAVLDFAAGSPPSNGLDILAWSSSHRTILAFGNEF